MKRKVYSANVVLWMLLLVFAACTAEDSESLCGLNEGRLSLGEVMVEVSVTNAPQTKGTPGNYDAPQPDKLTYTITNTQTSASTVYNYSELQASPVLAVGNYTLTATYGTESMGTTPYLYYSTAFAIQALQTTTLPGFTVPLACAIIRPSVSDLLPHFLGNVTLTLSNGSGTSLTVSNGTDYYVPAGQDYTLNISGTNQLGEAKTIQGNVNQAVVGNRYILNCTADVPIFSLPAQPDYNAWSYHIDFTPLTASNISYTAGMTTDKILNNLTYEYSADGGTTWQTFTGTTLSGLTPSTTYTFRARMGGVYSANQVSLTTEGAEPVPNGDMETWSNTSYTTYGTKTIYEYYCGASSTDKSWGTGNKLTMNGVSGGTPTRTSNQRVAYRWNSCSIPTSDANNGSGYAAEIRTMALANFNVNSGTVDLVNLSNRNKMVSNVLANCNIFIGYLYLGKSDMTVVNTIPDKCEIIHNARPKALAFYFKYAPYNSDSFTIKAELYSADKEMIASASYTSGANQSSYTLQTLPFAYTNLQKKANYLYIQFQSGLNTTKNDVTHIQGSYDSNPWSLDTFVGSVLKVDDIELIYD